MYLETMNTEEKLKEFQKAYDKILEVSNRIVSRLNPNKFKEHEEVSLGIRRLTICNTEYYYHLAVYKVRNKYKKACGKFKLAYVVNPFTIQTHGDARNKYIIMFHSIPPENISDWEEARIRVNAIVEMEYHIISRYRERFLKDPSIPIDECLKIFMKNNYDGYITVSDGKAVRVSKDGVALGVYCDNYTVKFKTFIIEEQLRDDQLLWSKYGEDWAMYLEKFEERKNNPKYYRGY